MSRSWSPVRIGCWLLALGLALALGGCAVDPGSGSPSATSPDTPLTTPLTTPVTPPVAPTDLDAPPQAMLAAEGGDPVVGQLGTYVWADGGSDSPWLPGAPIAVGAGEPLAVTLDGDALIESWTAIHVPATADGPAGAVTLGAGTGAASPTFAAPGPGSWTVDLEVVFAAGVGSAHYAWRLDVE